MIILVNSQPGVSKNIAAMCHKFSCYAFLVCCLNIMCLRFPPLSPYNEISMFQVCFVDLYHKLHLTVNYSHAVLYDLVRTCRLVVLNFKKNVTVSIQVFDDLLSVIKLSNITKILFVDI